MDLSRSNIGAKFRRLRRAGDTPSPSLVNYKYTSANDKYREVYPTPSADTSKFDDWGMIYVFNIDRYFDKHYPRAHIWIGVDISFPFPSTRRKVSSTNSSTLWNSVNRGKKAKEKKKKKKKHSKRLYSRVQWARFIPGKNILWKIGDDCSTFSREEPPGSAIFFITFLISYPPSLRNCNTNSYCDLCWYQWQPLVVSLLVRARPPPPPFAPIERTPSSLPPSLLLVQTLCFIESELSPLLLPSRHRSTPPSILASLASSTSSRFRFRSGCQTGPLGVVAQPVRGSLWILLIKQHRRAAAAPTKRRLTGVTRVSLCSGPDERGKSGNGNPLQRRGKEGSRFSKTETSAKTETRRSAKEVESSSVFFICQDDLFGNEYLMIREGNHGE